VSQLSVPHLTGIRRGIFLCGPVFVQSRFSKRNDAIAFVIGRIGGGSHNCPEAGRRLEVIVHTDRGLRLKVRVGYLEQRSTSDV
jgi:hypothetical protein